MWVHAMSYLICAFGVYLFFPTKHKAKNLDDFNTYFLGVIANRIGSVVCMLFALVWEIANRK